MTHLRTSAPCLCLVAALAGCDLDGKKVSTTIEDSLEKEGVVIDSFACPGGQPDKPGGTFECDGKDAQGTEFKVVVRTSGGGDITWNIAGRIVDRAEVRDRLMKRSGRELDCGTGKLVAVKGVEVACKDDRGVLAMVFSNEQGDGEVVEK